MLKEMPKVGDKVRYVGRAKGWMTVGKDYEISSIDEDGDALLYDNDGDVQCIMYYDFDNYDLIHTLPDTASLIANLALRVGELELQNAQQAYEINELYRADAERGVLR